jgi:hypothetical protein
VVLFYFDLNLKLYLKRFEKKQKKKKQQLTFLPSWPEGRRKACSPAPARVGRPSAAAAQYSRVQQPSPPSRAFSLCFADGWGPPVGLVSFLPS